MPIEVVLLSDVRPDRETQFEAAARLHPGGSFLEFGGGEISHFVDASGAGLLTVFATKAVQQPAGATASWPIHRSPSGCGPI